MRPNKSLPGWVKTVLTKRSAIERALGMPIGDPLGCGYWGCVFRSEGPWVVKLTRDPTEGPIWARLREWLRDAPCCTDGIVRVKDIVRIEPDLKFGRRQWPIHAIVREEAVPVLTEKMTPTEFTAERIGLPQEWTNVHASTLRAVDRSLREQGRSPASLHNIQDLSDALNGLDRFRVEAQEWHREAKKRRPSEGRLDDLAERMSSTTNLMRGSVAGSLGETLNQLIADDVVLQDVHWGNIGWRLHEEIDGDVANPNCLVIFDPGHTPTAPREDIRRLAPNGARALTAMLEAAATSYPVAGQRVGGLRVREHVPNMASIDGYLAASETLPGIRVMPMAAFGDPRTVFYAADDFERSERLAEAISRSMEINPLIVGIDEKGPFLIEGAHRFVALWQLKAREFPAVVVVGTDALAPNADVYGRTSTGRYAWAVRSEEKGTVETWISPHAPNTPEAEDDGTAHVLAASERLGLDDLDYVPLGAQW